MKIKFLPFLVAGLFATSLFFSSCLDNDNMENIILPMNSSIKSFSIGTVSIERAGKDTLGVDTIFIDTVSCAHYPFTIDQLKRTIENKDSLPVGSDVSKVLVSIEADSKVIMYEKRAENGELKDTLWASTDSIDFTRPVAFKVFAQNGMMGKSYMVKVNVHKQVPDTLVWAHFTTPKFASESLHKQKTVVKEQTLYTFGIKSDGTAVVETMQAKDGGTAAWREYAVLPANTNTYSAQVWNNEIYFVADGKLYKLNAEAEQGYTQVGTLDTLHTLVGIGKVSVYEEAMLAFNTNKKVVALDGNGSLVTEKEFGFVNDMSFATDRLSSVNYTTRHNKSLTRTIVMSNNPNVAENDTTSFVYNYTTNDTEWGKYTMPNPTTCPNLENISMIYYDNKLYAFGGGMKSKEIKPFEHFYCSIDNGRTWKKVTKNITFPQEDSEKHPDVRPFVNYYTPNVEGSYSAVVDSNHFIWLVWENGNVTRGRINRLGFAEKW